MKDQTPQNFSKNNEPNAQKAIFKQASLDYPCKKSVTVSTLNRELNKKERPFRCGFCEKSFTQSQAAKKHERIHTGEKPFVCKICDYKSNDSGNLRKHGKKIHGIVNHLKKSPEIVNHLNKSPEKLGTVDKLHNIYISGQ
jgi:uncharacterized Zn-finger protein